MSAGVKKYDPISAIYELLDNVMEEGSVPHMLVVPRRIVDDVADEFPNIHVYQGNSGGISCVTAEHFNYVNGELVLH